MQQLKMAIVGVYKPRVKANEASKEGAAAGRLLYLLFGKKCSAIARKAGMTPFAPSTIRKQRHVEKRVHMHVTEDLTTLKRDVAENLKKVMEGMKHLRRSEDQAGANKQPWDSR